MTGEAQVPVPTTVRATQHIRLPHIHDAYERLCVLTVLSSLGPLRLYAGRYTVASRFRCQPCGCGYIVRGLDDESAEQADAAIRRWMNVRGYRPHKRFYEKVIKVKADVAAVLNYFSPSCIDLRWVTWGAVKGAAERGRSS